MMVRCDGSTYPVEMTFSSIPAATGVHRRPSPSARHQRAQKIHEDSRRRKLCPQHHHSLEASLTRSTAGCADPLNDGWQRMPAEHGWLKVTEQPQMGRSLLDYVPDPPARGTGACVPNLPCEGAAELQSVDATEKKATLAHERLPLQHEGKIRG